MINGSSYTCYSIMSGLTTDLNQWPTESYNALMSAPVPIQTCDNFSADSTLTIFLLR